jgi:hypothetical protein
LKSNVKLRVGGQAERYVMRVMASDKTVKEISGLLSSAAVTVNA